MDKKTIMTAFSKLKSVEINEVHADFSFSADESELNLAMIYEEELGNLMINYLSENKEAFIKYCQTMTTLDYCREKLQCMQGWGTV